MNTTPKDKSDHLLSLKVMRLTKPTLGTPVAISTEAADLPGDLLNLDLKQDPTADPDIPTLCSGQHMLIPQSFGNIHLGETFSCYVFTNNESMEVAKNVSVRADLQTTSSRLTLVDSNPDSCKELPPNGTLDMIISHEVKEIGSHILICEVSYLNSAEKRASFRKFFKFSVLKPLDVKTKIYNAEDYISDEVFLEAQVQNLTAGPINLEKVSLEPIGAFKVKCLNAAADDEPGAGILQPQSSRQYLYCLSPQPQPAVDRQKTSSEVGILDIVWRSNMGERGRLQTSPLERTTPEYPEIRMSITKLPNIVKLEEPFSFTCKVSNLSKRAMDLTLVMDRQSDMAWVGISGRSIGTLEPGMSTPLDFTIVPLNKGLRPISGIRLRDDSLKRTYDYDDFAQNELTPGCQGLFKPLLPGATTSTNDKTPFGAVVRQRNIYTETNTANPEYLQSYRTTLALLSGSNGK